MKWNVLIIVLGVLVCFGQWGKTQDLKERISKLERRQAERTDGSKTYRDQELDQEQSPPAQPPNDPVGTIDAMVQDLHRFRGSGNPEIWAALGLAIFTVPPDEIPALAETLWAEDFSPNKAWIIQALIEHWSQYDVNAALQAANQLTGHNQVMALRGLCSPLLEHDPHQFEEIVLQHPIAQELSFPYIEFLVKKDPQEAARFVLQNMGGENDMTVHAVSKFWTQQDPEAALCWAISLPNKLRHRTQGQRSEALYAVFATWSKFDRESALEAALDIEPGFSRTIGLSIIVEDWVGDDAEAAFDFVFERLPREDRNNRRMLQSVAAKLDGIDTDKVIAAAMQIENPELRDTFLKAAASRKAPAEQREKTHRDL